MNTYVNKNKKILIRLQGMLLFQKKSDVILVRLLPFLCILLHWLENSLEFIVYIEAILDFGIP